MTSVTVTPSPPGAEPELADRIVALCAVQAGRSLVLTSRYVETGDPFYWRVPVEAWGVTGTGEVRALVSGDGAGLCFVEDVTDAAVFGIDDGRMVCSCGAVRGGDPDDLAWCGHCPGVIAAD